MCFIREIPVDRINQQNLNSYIHQEGFTLIWKEDSVEIWADVKTEVL